MFHNPKRFWQATSKKNLSKKPIQPFFFLVPKKSLFEDLGFSDASLTAHEIALAEVGAIGIAAACEAVLATASGKVKAVKSAVPSNVAAWEWWRGETLDRKISMGEMWAILFWLT